MIKGGVFGGAKTDKEKFDANFDEIDWSGVKDKPIDEDKVKKTKRHVTAGLCGESGFSTFDENAYKENYERVFGRK